MNGINGIFAEMRKTRLEAVNEEKEKEVKETEQMNEAADLPEDKEQPKKSEEKSTDPNVEEQVNEENLDEMSRSAEKDMIKIARPIVQKMAYKAGVKVKNPGQNSSRFILVGDGARAVASAAAKAVKSKLSEVSTLEGPDAARIKAAKVSAEDKKKYGIDGECAAVIVDAVEISEENMDETSGLEVNKKATNGKAFTVTINGKKYSYYPKEESGLTAKELGEKYTKISKYSVGKALAWLRKNATTPDSYRKKVVNEEMINEDFSWEELGDQVCGIMKVENMTKEEFSKLEKSIKKYVAKLEKAGLNPYYEPDVSKENGKVNGTVSIYYDAEDEDFDEDQVNEEMQIIVDADDILKAASAIEKAQADGKDVQVVQTVNGFKVDAIDAPSEDEDPEVEEECGSKKDEACNKDEETCPICGKKHKKGEKCCEESANEEELDEAAEGVLREKANAIAKAALKERDRIINQDKPWDEIEKEVEKFDKKYNIAGDIAISAHARDNRRKGRPDLNVTGYDQIAINKSIKRHHSKNEEVDVAELAVRLDECEGSEYMHKALEDGKYELVKKYLYLREE